MITARTSRVQETERLSAAFGSIARRTPTMARTEIECKGYDLKAVNPHAKGDEDTRTPAELLDFIEAKAREVAEALALLRSTV